MQRKPLSHTQRVGITASTLALTAILAISQVATGGLFTTPAIDSDYRTTPQTNALQLSHNPHAHTPTHSTHTHTHVTGHRPAKKHLHGLTKTQLAEIGKKIGLNTPNLYPQGYPMVSIGDSTMALAPTKNQALNLVSACHHFVGAWPLQVSTALGLPLADLSCSGSKSSLYWKLNTEQYLGSNTRLVLLSYGSNDLRVVNQLASDNKHPGTGPYLTHKKRSILEDDLVDILVNIRDHAPNALIITVGYLPLVEGGRCKNLPNMTSLEMSRVESLRQQADEALTNAATRASDYSASILRKHGIHIATTTTSTSTTSAARTGIVNVPFRNVMGHTLCASDTKRFILNHEGTGVRYHYTTAGLHFVAQAVEHRYITDNPIWTKTNKPRKK